jgi:hypothetical protein
MIAKCRFYFNRVSIFNAKYLTDLSSFKAEAFLVFYIKTETYATGGMGFWMTGIAGRRKRTKDSAECRGTG